jgi:hypothetical protein
MMAITIFINLSSAQAASIPVTALSGGRQSRFTNAQRLRRKRAIKPRANSFKSAMTAEWRFFVPAPPPVEPRLSAATPAFDCYLA